MDNLPKGKANEKSGDGRKSNPVGLYFHSEAKVWVEARNVPQADAFVRLGYTLATPEQKKYVETERAKLKSEK
jgi:hypothetical protein